MPPPKNTPPSVSIFHPYAPLQNPHYLFTQITPFITFPPPPPPPVLYTLPPSTTPESLNTLLTSLTAPPAAFPIPLLTIHGSYTGITSFLLTFSLSHFLTGYSALHTLQNSKTFDVPTVTDEDTAARISEDEDSVQSTLKEFLATRHPLKVLEIRLTVPDIDLEFFRTSIEMMVLEHGGYVFDNNDPEMARVDVAINTLSWIHKVRIKEGLIAWVGRIFGIKEKRWVVECQWEVEGEGAKGADGWIRKWEGVVGRGVREEWKGVVVEEREGEREGFGGRAGGEWWRRVEEEGKVV